MSKPNKPIPPRSTRPPVPPVSGISGKFVQRSRVDDPLSAERTLAAERLRIQNENAFQGKKIHHLENTLAKHSEDLKDYHAKEAKHSKKENAAQKFLANARMAMKSNFLAPSPSLGFGRFNTPQRGSAYIKGILTLNADGSGYILANPNFNSMIYANSASYATTTTGSWIAASNSTVALATVASARPLGLTMRAWLDAATTSIPGMSFCGQTDLAAGDFSTVVTGTSNTYTTATLYPITVPYIVQSATNTITSATQVIPGASTQTMYAVPYFKEDVAFKPLECSLIPNDISVKDFKGSYGGGQADSILIPAAAFSNTSSFVSAGGIGGNSGCVLEADPVVGFPGPFLFMGFGGCPASTPVYYEAFYEFEYETDTKSSFNGGAGPFGNNSGRPSSANDFYASPDEYYRELKNLKPEKEPEKKKDDDNLGFFGKVAKGVMDAINSPLGEMVLDGISSLAGLLLVTGKIGVPQVEVYRRGTEYFAKTPGGLIHMSNQQIKDYISEQAVLKYQARAEVKQDTIDPDVQTWVQLNRTALNSQTILTPDQQRAMSSLVGKVKPTSRIGLNE